MWEVTVAAEHVADLLRWVTTAVAGREAEVYRSADRVVVLLHGYDDARPFPDPPPDLVTRPAHAWDFERVRTAGDGAASAATNGG
jgi:hypothetical protein